MTKLIILGDSFCHGIGTVSTVLDANNTQYAFGKYIADKLGYEYINLAEPGSSVSRLIEKGFVYLTANYHFGDLVIIGWTSPLRLNVVNGKLALQILPEFVWLGNLDETDLAVSTSSIKCVTDMSNEPYLKSLTMLHRAFVQNNLFQALENQSYIYANIFKSWLKDKQINFKDFSVFGNKEYQPQIDISFNDIMPVLSRHPTILEQQRFAQLLLEKL